MWPVLVAPVVNSPVFIDSNSLSKDGRTIRVGECALFKPTHNTPPFVGLIRRVIVDKEDNLRLSVNWLYRPVDVKLLKGALLEAAPNEVFYSFHQEEIPAASLLHPCKVAFLRKGVELPSRTSSFVCRRVYDIETKRLWWLTDKNYINERKEVDQLLDKTRVEMYGALQAGGHSPKPLNSPNGTTQFKSNTEILQKSKKREHGGHSSDSVKRERLSKADDADSAHLKPENMLKIEIAKITDKGSLVDFEGVEKLIQLMRPESGDKKLDLACRVMLVDVISVTERFDCLTRFVQRRGLHVIDEWLQEVHKGKIGDGSPKGSDKSIEEFIFALLRALDRLPVNLLALQTCNIGKSVNHLRSHKNSEIQKKARSLVDTWKKRVEAEMNVVETRSGTRRGGAWPNKSMMPEVSPTSSRRVSGSSDVDAKISTSQISALRSPQGKPNSSEVTAKSPESPGSVKLLVPVVPGSGSLTIKEEKCSSSSPSSECRTGGSCKEDAPSASGNINKNSNGVSQSRKSSTPLGSTVVSVQKEMGLGKCSSVDRNSPNKGTPEGAADVSSADNINNQRLIVRLPNVGRSPASEDASTSSGKSSLDHSEKRGKGDTTPMDLCDGKDGLVDSDECKKGVVNPCGEKQGQDGENVERLTTVSKDSGLVKSGKTYEASYSSINALVESCAKFSQGNSSVPMGDDVGMNLLASVAAGEMSRSGSPENKRPLTEDTSTQPVACKSEDNLEVTNGHVKMEHISSIEQLSAKGGSQQQVSPPVSHLSVDSKAASVGCEKTVVFITQLDSSVGLLQNGINAPEVKPAALAADASALLSSIDSKNSGKEGEEAMESYMVLSNATTSAKVGTQINDESASRSSSEKQKELDKDSELPTTSCVYDEDKKMGSHAEQSEKTKMDHDSSVLQQTSEHIHESLDKNEVSVKSPEVLVHEGKIRSNQTEVAEGDPTTSMPVPETVVKLDFDLNELLPSDDGIQGDVERFSTVHTPCSLPSASSMLTGNRPASVTVAAAAKGPFFPSENLLRGKAELGWKGSAATSAFRPAEPRKVIDVRDNRASRQARAFLDFDLNVGVVEDATSGGGGGLDLNLNACDESPEVGPLPVSYSRTSISQLPSRSLLSGRFSNTQPGFDLNNGPCAEEVGGESLPLSRNGMQFLSNVPSVRMNNMEMGGNYSSWFPPTSAYPTAILPVPGRGEQQSYPMIPSAGSQTLLNPGTSFNPEIFRGPVLSSSPAVAYSSTTPFQFPGFPFETNFSLPSNTAYVGSSGGQLCFPTVSPQLVGSSSMVSTPYRPYVMSLPGSGSSNVGGPDNRKWGSQGLDLNSGPGGPDLQLPQSVADEQLKMFQQMTAGSGGGGLLKRKEPPVEGWDGSYKHHHPSWQ